MKKVQKISIEKQLENLKGVFMKKSDNLPKLDPTKLKQIPDEVNIASKIIKYHPDASVYEKVVREDNSDAMNELRKKIIKKLS